MMYLYSLLLLGSILVPLCLSFDRKLRFYRQWKSFFPAVLIVAAFYIAFDIAFTRAGIWGFNARYHSPIVLAGLPLEEWLFFVVIPYASVFLHDSVVLYFPTFRLSRNAGRLLSVLLLVGALALILFHYDKAYTAYIFSLMVLVLLLAIGDKSRIVDHFYVSFVVILIPFVLVNAILTGSWIDEPVVWYNNGENLGIRLLTIPVEDVFYAFSLILFSLLLRNYFQKRQSE